VNFGLTENSKKLRDKKREDMFKLLLKLGLLNGSSLSNVCVRHDPDTTRISQRKKD
jgi:hypothetical protein